MKGEGTKALGTEYGVPTDVDCVLLGNVKVDVTILGNDA